MKPASVDAQSHQAGSYLARKRLKDTREADQLELQSRQQELVQAADLTAPQFRRDRLIRQTTLSLQKSFFNKILS